MFILERLNKELVRLNREGGYTYQTRPKIKKIIVGISEANEIMQLVSECHPNCPYRFGFDSVGHMLNLKQHQFEIAEQYSRLEIEFEK